MTVPGSAILFFEKTTFIVVLNFFAASCFIDMPLRALKILHSHLQALSSLGTPKPST